MHNTVSVSLVDNSKEQQEDFKKVFASSMPISQADSELIKFKQDEYATSTNIKAGGKVKGSKEAGDCSMGFRTKLN